MPSPQSRYVYTYSKFPTLFIGVLLAGLAFCPHAQADERVDQAAVELLVSRIAWGTQSRGNAEAFLGQELLTQQFYRVKTNGESRLLSDEELTQLPAVAPGIDDDDLGDVRLSYLHVSVFGLSAIATASVKDQAGEMRTFAIMCVETPPGWKIAALLAR